MSHTRGKRHSICLGNAEIEVPHVRRFTLQRELGQPDWWVSAAVCSPRLSQQFERALGKGFRREDLCAVSAACSV